jgi:hypothetical protein
MITHLHMRPRAHMFARRVRAHTDLSVVFRWPFWQMETGLSCVLWATTPSCC